MTQTLVGQIFAWTLVPSLLERPKLALNGESDAIAAGYHKYLGTTCHEELLHVII
jgi:hypothetical protein